MIVEAANRAIGIGEISPAIPSLFASTVGYDPGSGGWSEKFPTLPGLPGLGPPSPKSPGPFGTDPQALSKCTAECLRKLNAGKFNEGWFPWLPGGDQQLGYQKCIDACNKQFNTGRQPLVDTTPTCPGCSATNIPACLSCAWTYVAHAGIEIGLVALLLLGLYLWLK